MKLGVALLSILFTACRTSSVCSGIDEPNAQAMQCYVGTFLTKMFSELNAGPALGPARKTAEHVRVHLLPFIGGPASIAAVRDDSPRSGNCTVCYSDEDIADALEALRKTVPADQTEIYDNLKVCYMRLTDAIMDLLPKSDDGTFLVPVLSNGQPITPDEQVKSIFYQLLGPSWLIDYSGCLEVPNVPDPKMPAQWVWVDVCNSTNHGFSDPNEAAVFCYVASFMSKMMWELTLCPPLGWCRKTGEHVRVHFTPYMGGSNVSNRTFTDSPSDPNCTACYNDDVCAPHQMLWLKQPCCYDNSTTPRCTADTAPVESFQKAVEVYNSLSVCYVPFANYFMEALPKIGHWLVAPEAHETPFTAVLRITKDIFQKAGVRGCGQHTQEAPVAAFVV